MLQTVILTVDVCQYGLSFPTLPPIERVQNHDYRLLRTSVEWHWTWLTVGDTINLLRETFGVCIISRKGPVRLDLSDYVISHLFSLGLCEVTNLSWKPATLDHLEVNFLEVNSRVLFICWYNWTYLSIWLRLHWKINAIKVSNN